MVMADILFDPEPDAELTRMETDNRRSAITGRVVETLHWLASDPTDSRIRRERFTNGLWATYLRVGDDECAIVWDGEDLPETITVFYLGAPPINRRG